MLSTMVIPNGVTPKHPLKLTLTLEFELWSCPEATTHSATFTFQDTTCDVSEDKDHIGSIAGGLGGVYLLHDDKEDITYALDPREAWAVFQKAIQQNKNQRKE